MTDHTAWLFDIGSTFTKLAVVDLRYGTSQSTMVPTTRDDLSRGVDGAVAAIVASTKLKPGAASLRAACSSAAGGLAMVVSGFVIRMSLEAGRRAALGAGAKLIGCWANRLRPDDVAAIDAAEPNIVLLTGGTDGGDRDVLLHNARALTSLRSRPAILVAGNTDVSTEASELLSAAGLDSRPIANILPEIDRLDVEPTRAAIRQLFLERIAKGPNLATVSRSMDQEVVPTPKAVLDGVGVASDTLGRSLLAIEVGGATTNVHSSAPVEPPAPAVFRRGLPRERLHRTIEGDLGVRHSAQSAAALAGAEWFDAELPQIADMVPGYVEHVSGTARLPRNPAEQTIDGALALFCAKTAIDRHAGHHLVRRGPEGDIVIEDGKDLRAVATVVGTGGAIIRNVTAADLRRAFADSNPTLLIPRSPEVMIDRDYLLFTIGLLQSHAPDAAAAVAARIFHNSQ